jgi:accessory colonization factor AcfC
MASIQLRDANNNTINLLVASGAGTPSDPYAFSIDASAPIRTYTATAAATATSGDQTLVAAPAAGNHLVVKDLLVQNESTTETTVILKSGSTAKWRAKLAANASLALSFADGEEWRLGSAEALVLNLSEANSHGYSIRSLVEAD